MEHTRYAVSQVPKLDLHTLALACVAGAVFGFVALLFSTLTHHIAGFYQRHIRWAPLRPCIGGAVIALGALAVRTTRYLGLGLPQTAAAFHGFVPAYDWVGKLVFTAATLGSGLKGGEVTPLFFIGATLGNALAHVLPLPSSLLAGMGFVAVFAGAANTPIASALLAMELFGADAGAYAAIACVVAYLFSGQTGIYSSQKFLRNKHGLQSAGKNATQLADSDELAVHDL